MLDSLLEELDPPAGKLMKYHGAVPGRNKKHPARFLLSVVLATRLLKNPSNLKTLVQEKLTELLPIGLRTLIRYFFENDGLPIPSWDSRLVLLVDVALMLYRRAHVSTVAGYATWKKFGGLLGGPDRRVQTHVHLALR